MIFEIVLINRLTDYPIDEILFQDGKITEKSLKLKTLIHFSINMLTVQTLALLIFKYDKYSLTKISLFLF